MFDIDKLLESKRIEVSFADKKIDGQAVKQLRQKNGLTQVALANVLGVKKKTIEKWEQGVNNVNGSSAVLLRLLQDNPELMNQLYKVNIVSGKRDTEDYKTIACKELNEKLNANWWNKKKETPIISFSTKLLKGEAI